MLARRVTPNDSRRSKGAAKSPSTPTASASASAVTSARAKGSAALAGLDRAQPKREGGRAVQALYEMDAEDELSEEAFEEMFGEEPITDPEELEKHTETLERQEAEAAHIQRDEGGGVEEVTHRWRERSVVRRVNAAGDDVKGNHLLQLGDHAHLAEGEHPYVDLLGRCASAKA